MSSLLKKFAVGSVIVSLAACSFLLSSQQPVQSENDSRRYHAVTLSNQLNVLLISDPNAEKAAASLDLNIGSRQDPKQSEGLAHFLEHMLFLGTEKYPDPGAYQKFINSHGGGHNAYTAFEHTNYFFDIEPQYLSEALDRFSQFFVAPLFTEAYVEREKNAVHSEYMAKLKTDGRKSLDVFKQQVNPNHPFAKFSVGNLTTLSSSSEGELRKELIDFYQQYYSANVMRLVVIGQEPIAELQAMVESRFSAIENRHTVLTDIEEPLFEAGSLPRQIMIKPEQEQRTLSLNFPVDDVYHYYREKPMVYIGNILGHEGEGSLLSYLKQKGWAEGLSAGAGLSYKGGSNFSIAIKLTKSGYQHYSQVVTAVFQTLQAIKQAGPQDWLYQEQASISSNHFRYQESVQPISYSRQLASSMHYYPIEDVLRGPYMMEDFNKTLIERYLSALTPNNMLLTLTAPEVMTQQKSHYYQTPYSANAIAADEIKVWQQPALNSDIRLPTPNRFIANNFQLLAADTSNTVPELIVDKPQLRWWFKNDEQFNIPKGFISISMRSPMAAQSAEQVVLLKLYQRMLQEQINEYAYPAALAGLNYSLKAHMRGLSLKVSGFSDKQALLFEQVLAAVVAPEFKQLRFDTIKADMLRNFDNAAKQQPYSMLMGDLSELMYKPVYSESTMLAALAPLELDDLERYVGQFLQQLDVDGMVYGNYSQQQAVSIADQVASQLALTSQQAVKLPSIDVHRLNNKPQALVVANEYSDAALLYYIQADNDEPQTKAAFSVAAQLYKSEFYTLLRTEKQLGYIVTSGAYPIYEVPGLFFVVQSPVAGAISLQTEISEFLSAKNGLLKEVSEQDFDDAKRVLLKRYLQKATNLGESQDRYWQDIALRYYDFDSRDQMIAALNKLTLPQWRQLMLGQVFSEQVRSLWLYAAGDFAEEQRLPGLHIKSMQAFDTQQGYYSFQ